MTLLVACGLKREAAIIRRTGADATIIIGGGDARRLARDLEDKAATLPGIVLSFGLAGALDPTLRAGDLVIDGDRPGLAWLRTILPRARVGGVTGSTAIVATATDKRALAATSGAVAVDVETGVARAVAERYDLPFGAIRAISDAADDDLPPATLVGMRADGGMALGAVLKSLAGNPAQLGALLRIGRHANLAFHTLEHAARTLVRYGLDRADMATSDRD